MKISEYIANFLVSRNVNKVFSVTGGFAMHLNDSFGEKLNVTYTHGESPAGYASLGWSSVDHTPSVCCVTSGCGATNAITPCLIAYQDSVPVLFMSGQVQKDVNIRSRGGSIRGYFGSDCDIVECVKGITKFTYEIREPDEVRKVLEEAWWNLTTGRLGPVWISIPVDVQAMHIDESKQVQWNPPENVLGISLSPKFYNLWEKSSRPIVLAGNGIHQSVTKNIFKQFLNTHNIPYVVSFFGSDLGHDYIGKVGIIGDRAGNFAIQNADLVICLGCRLSKTITGYKRDLFAREASVICVDVDESENIIDKNIDLFVHMDLRTFFDIELPKKEVNDEWLTKTSQWKSMWTYQVPPNETNLMCPYEHLNQFFINKPGKTNVIASSGSLYCVQWHMYRHKKDDRYITSGHGDMGYEVPVSIGSAMKNGNRTFCLIGDGSFQYNINDLQTIKQHNLPITVMVFNNGGYGAIKITQESIFKREYGTSNDSNLDFCNIERITKAYELPYYKVSSYDDTNYINHDSGPLVVEIVCKITERWPKVSNKPLEDGTFKNMPHEEMAPFLDDDTIESNLMINRLK
jgi:acetolactate synthase-1/2/3 large subunit